MMVQPLPTDIEEILLCLYKGYYMHSDLLLHILFILHQPQKRFFTCRVCIANSCGSFDLLNYRAPYVISMFGYKYKFAQECKSVVLQQECCKLSGFQGITRSLDDNPIFRDLLLCLENKGAFHQMCEYRWCVCVYAEQKNQQTGAPVFFYIKA